jgi:hypothetical protein
VGTDKKVPGARGEIVPPCLAPVLATWDIHREMEIFKRILPSTQHPPLLAMTLNQWYNRMCQIATTGTRDQCSLALRSACALATLAQELGVAPGFIFLDEPLSAFDAQRAQPLVELITTGIIAQQCNQVVLISHQHALIVKRSSIMFAWNLVRLSNLIYLFQKMVLLKLFRYSQSIVAVNRKLSHALLLRFAYFSL